MTWKDDFLKWCMSDDIELYGKALKLKQNNLPEKIYRYRSVSDDTLDYRYREIFWGELYLAHPNEFEVSSLLQSEDPADYVSKKVALKSAFNNTMTPADYSDIFDSENWFERLITYIAEKSVSPENIEVTEANLKKVIISAIEDINSYVSKDVQKIMRIASFTTKPDNLPMWHHYADGHKGICLEYNTKDISNIYQINRLFPVYYVDCLMDFIYLMIHKIEPRFPMFDYMAIQKLKDWSYEDEWRLIYDIDSFYHSPEDDPDEFWNNGKVIQFIPPSRIILGTNISSNHERKIREMAQKVSIPVAKTMKNEYGLKIDLL